MELRDPALVVAVFYAAGDSGAEQLWDRIPAPPSQGESELRRERMSLNGATAIQVTLERAGMWAATVWQELSAEMAQWLGRFDENPPGRPWGASRVYLGAAVADLYEEQNLLSEGLDLPTERPHPPVSLPTGRLWLIAPPATAEGGYVAATYAWVYAPTRSIRQQLEKHLWGETAAFLRAELYLHRALFQLRQYGRDQRAAFWNTLEQLESAAAAGGQGQGHTVLQQVSRAALRDIAHLSRRHNILRSSAYLYRQICSEFRHEKGELFPWYEDRLKEALIQWGYDLDRADRAVALASTALLASRIAAAAPAAAASPAAAATAPAAAPISEALPAEPSQPTLTGLLADVPRWMAVLFGAAILLLCLVDDSWEVSLIRTGAVLLVLLVAGTILWLRQRGRRTGPTAPGDEG